MSVHTLIEIDIELSEQNFDDDEDKLEITI